MNKYKPTIKPPATEEERQQRKDLFDRLIKAIDDSQSQPTNTIGERFKSPYSSLRPKLY